jgi:FkbM family methyltransferase
LEAVSILAQEAQPMKLFRLPDGLQVWNGPESGSDTHFLYREIFERRSYEKHGVAVSHGDVIFDVGANIGMFGLSLMRRFRNLQIYCFEPVPGTYACLVRNLAESPLRTSHEVMTLNHGLGAADAQTTIEYFPGAPSNSTLYSLEKHRDFPKILDSVRWADMWRTKKSRALLLLPLFPFRKRLLGPAYERMLAKGVSMPCQVRTLSGTIDEHHVERIDLLKIDVEGAEMDVLAGIEDRHWPLIRQLSMEVDPANKHHVPTVIDRLRELGFLRVAVDSMFGGPSKLDDAIACTIYAVRDCPTSVKQ